MATRYWVGGGSAIYWDSVGPTNWSVSSGGPNDASLPTSADDAVFDANSGAGPSIANSFYVVGTLDCTGYVGSLAFDFNVPLTIAGNKCKFSSGMTYTTQTNGESIKFTFPGTVQLTSAGKTLGGIVINNTGTTLQLLDDLTIRKDAVFSFGPGTIASGFDANGHNVTVGSIDWSSAIAGAPILMGSGLWTITGTGGETDWSPGTNVMLNKGTADILFAPVTNSTGLRQFNGGSYTYNNIHFGSNSNGGTIGVTGSFTANIMTIDTPNTVSFSPISETVTLAGLSITGSAGLYLFTNGSTNATISIASGNIVIPRSAVRLLSFTGGASFVAPDSLDFGGNTGITFMPPSFPPTYVH